ncbi:MAG TPA: hypothetical protein H9671_10875 [Firmicutes bacterium]|nr:hypothetical protein [Bacillota bacterium]
MWWLTFSSALTLLIVGALIQCAKQASQKKEKKMALDNFILRAPLSFPILFLIISLVFAFFLIASMTFMHNETSTLSVYLLFGGFSAVPLLFALCLLWEKVTVEQEKITVRRPFRRTQVYYFPDITSVKQTSLNSRVEQGFKVYAGKTMIFSFSNLYIGYRLMYKRLLTNQLIYPPT